MINELNGIYNKIGDDLSKDIFSYRLMYSLSGDNYWIKKMFATFDEGRVHMKKMEKIVGEGKAILFGAGLWGKYLIDLWGADKWLYVVDSHAKEKTFFGLKEVNFSEFRSIYKGENIVISSRLYNREMFQQLLDIGILKDRIYNHGELDDTLVMKQYFDLQELHVNDEKEVFIDCGCFDGMSSIYFKQWCNKEDYMVYAFEPDPNNRKKCEKNFREYNINNKIIPKGVWDQETELQFDSKGNGESSLSDGGDIVVETTKIDSELENIPISFIKMDIEGAELKALYGAKETIKKYKPKCAISIYHKPEDIWEIPKLLLEYNPDYKFYLRHYSLSWFDTVLYAI